MRDDTCKSSIQASTPKVASPAWDPRNEDGHGPREPGQEEAYRRLGTGRGKEAMYAGQQDGHLLRNLEERILLQTSHTPYPTFLKPLKRKFTIQEASQMAVASDPSWRRNKLQPRHPGLNRGSTSDQKRERDV